ncbi:unnamed protein product [Periconia digitata]|uniref:Hypersensitive response-inducing protein n=1 Tax=Periconia digitata TaxID=1303443 RepID=A0A9W4XF07_9PLEO|nr:unnamed protein product [Periconia digitata]
MTTIKHSKQQRLRIKSAWAIVSWCLINPLKLFQPTSTATTTTTTLVLPNKHFLNRQNQRILQKMQFFSLAATSLLAATTASAAAVPRDTNAYDITEFYANCVPHSVMCNYQFQVVRSNAGETIPVKCSLSLTSPDGKLPPVTEGPCEQSSRTFDVSRTEDGGLKFEVSQPVSPASNLTGVYEIKSEDLVVEVSGASQAEVYRGVREFGLAYE